MIADPTVNSQQLSNAKKLQLFAVLANCSRSAGNLHLAAKFFEYSKQLARIFYDDLEVEEPFIVGLGFLFMAIYACATSRAKASRYVLSPHISTMFFFFFLLTHNRNSMQLAIGRSIVQEAVTVEGDPRNHLKFFMAEIDFVLKPQVPKFAISFPLTECFQRHLAIDNPETTEAARTFPPVQIYVTESYQIPSLYNEDKQRLNPLVPLWFQGHELPSPVTFRPEDFPSSNLTVVEFFLFSRCVIIHFLPRIARVLQEDHIVEEDFSIPFGTFPEELANSLLAKFHQVLASRVPVVHFFGVVVSGIFQAMILYSLRRFDECREAMKPMTKMKTDLLLHDIALTSPPFLLPPILLVANYLHLELGLMEEYNYLGIFLRHYKSIGFAFISSGLQALSNIKNKRYPSSFTQDTHATQTIQPVGLSSPEASDFFPTPQTPARSQSEYPEENFLGSEAGAFSFLTDDLDSLNSLNFESEPELPMDVLFNFLNPNNEQKVMEELGPLFSGL